VTDLRESYTDFFPRVRNDFVWRFAQSGSNTMIFIEQTQYERCASPASQGKPTT